MKRILYFILSLYPLLAVAGNEQVRDSIKQLIRTSMTEAHRINQQVALSKAFIDVNIDSSEYYIKIAYQNAIDIDYEKGIIATLNIKGNILQRRGKLDESMQMYEVAKKMALKNNDDSSLAKILNNIGIIHNNKGEFNKALEAYFQALDYEKKINHKRGIAEAYNNIGVVHYYLSDMENTLMYLKKSSEISKEIGDLEILKKGLINIGAIHRYRGEYDEALSNYYEALEICEVLGNHADMNTSWHNIAEVYSLQHRYKESEEYYRKALVFNQKFDNKNGLALEYNNIGSLYLKQNRYKEAKEYFEKALTISREAGYRKLKEDIYDGLANLYAKQNNFAKAFEYSQMYIKLKDSILNEENSKNIAELRTKYETAEKEKLLAEEKGMTAILRSEKAEAELETVNRNKWIIFLGLIMIAASMVFLAIVQNNKRKAQAEIDAAIIEERDQGVNAVIQAQEEERKRISKELHDGIGQQLSGLKMAFQRLEDRLNQEIPHRKDEIKRLVSIISDSADEVRTISHQMMPRALTEDGLLPAIGDLLTKSLEPLDIKHDYEHYGISGRLEERIELSLYRVLQELINNIIKHAEATEVNVQLLKNGDRIILMVEDNGKGFVSDSKSDGHGLLNIKSRINSLGGDVNYTPSPNHGTVVTIRIPLSKVQNYA